MINQTQNLAETVLAPLKNDSNRKTSVAEVSQSFSSFLKDSIDQVNRQQLESKMMSEKLLTGEIEDIHQVTIAGQKALLGLQLTLQVRNKVIEAYQEVMRMQI